MSGTIVWNGRAVSFRSGETVASALARAGVARFGTAPTGQARAVFCGIGQCQSCLVHDGTGLTEACLLPCRDGLSLSDTGGHDHD
jgi:hypothetical protein